MLYLVLIEFLYSLVVFVVGFWLLILSVMYYIDNLYYFRIGFKKILVDVYKVVYIFEINSLKW